MAIVLPDLLDPKHVKLSLRSRTAGSAIRELTGLLASTEHLIEADKFTQQVLARERTNPSVVEQGVVFPHARTDAVPKILLAIGRKPGGIPFGRAPGRANLIFVIGVPQRLVNDYLVCVGALARIVRNDRFRAELLGAATPEGLVQILMAASSPEGNP
jgi:mannitol/fructose-specific phosphotransferase system IIA component (Ntr-type)